MGGRTKRCGCRAVVGPGKMEAPSGNEGCREAVAAGRGKGAAGLAPAVGQSDTSVLPSLGTGEAWEGSTANPTSAMPHWGLGE